MSADEHNNCLPTVCVNAWQWDGEGQTYADAQCGDRVDGWSVYVRWDDLRGHEWGGQFDISDEHDFDTYEEAMAFAVRLVDQIGEADIHEY